MKTFRLSPAGYLLSAMAITLVFATVESGVASIPKLDRVRVLETPKAITDVELVDQHDGKHGEYQVHQAHQHRLHKRCIRADP